MTAKTDGQNADAGASGHSLQRVVRRLPRRPGNGWKQLNGSVWEHATGLRIHLLGLARMPDGHSISWPWHDEYNAKRQQGYNSKRALMVWALTLIAPNTCVSDGPTDAPESTRSAEGPFAARNG